MGHVQSSCMGQDVFVSPTCAAFSSDVASSSDVTLVLDAGS